MPIAPVLQRFVDDELALAPALVERVLAGTLQLLRDSRGADAQNGPERAHHFAIMEALQRHGAAYRQGFVDALIAAVKASLAEHDGGPFADPLAPAGGLELMDESQVEIDIEISRAMQLIDTTAEWELRELQTFTSTLVGQIHVSTESNPFRPAIYAAALWEAACAATPALAQRTTLLRVSAGVAAGLLKKAWAAASTRLEAQGVEPGIYRTVLLAPGTTPDRPTAGETGAGALTTLLASMPTGDKSALQIGVGKAAIAFGTPPARSPARPMSPEFDQALARLDEVLRHLPPSGATAREHGATLVKRLNLHRAALAASAAQPGERQVIELLARLFDSMLADPQVPPAFATVLVRLQASALRVAMREPEMLASTTHPVWLLLDRIAESGAGLPNVGDPRGTALLAFSRALIEPLSRAAVPDGTLYRRAQAQLDGFLADQLQAQVRAARPAIQQLQRSERREVLGHQLSQRLADQVAPLRISATLRRFMTGPWAQVLAESMLRDGEDAETTRAYIKLVDELLWSLRLPDHPQSRQRLVSLLPGMLQRLRSGMASIKLPAAEQDQLLDELMAIHTVALRPGSRAEQEALTAEQIVQRMRDEVLPPATGHGGFSDSVIDLASLETVPAELMPESPAAERAQRVEALRPGDRLRMFLHGRWSRVQVLWRSDQGLFVLFAGEVPGRTHSITLRALERLAAAGLVQPLEARSLVQRALDNVTRSIAAPG